MAQAFNPTWSVKAFCASSQNNLNWEGSRACSAHHRSAKHNTFFFLLQVIVSVVWSVYICSQTCCPWTSTISREHLPCIQTFSSVSKFSKIVDKMKFAICCPQFQMSNLSSLPSLAMSLGSAFLPPSPSNVIWISLLPLVRSYTPEKEVAGWPCRAREKEGGIRSQWHYWFTQTSFSYPPFSIFHYFPFSWVCTPVSVTPFGKDRTFKVQMILIEVSLAGSWSDTRSDTQSDTVSKSDPCSVIV